MLCYLQSSSGNLPRSKQYENLLIAIRTVLLLAACAKTPSLITTNQQILVIIKPSHGYLMRA